MQSEQEWLGRDDSAATVYKYFTRPEPFEDLGPIEEVEDEYLGKTICREMRVGMVRNAKEEDKKAVVAYLKPFPHTRLNKGADLRGWYKALKEPEGVRNRPCFSEAILTTPYSGYCLPEGSLVETPTGSVPINKLRIGDVILGQVKDQLVEAKVLATVTRISQEGLVKLVVGNDFILLTKEHPVFSLSRNDYIPAGEIYVGEEIETRAVQDLSEAYSNRQMGEYSSLLRETPIWFDENESPSAREERPYKSNLDLLPAKLQSSLSIRKLKSLSALCYSSPNPKRKNEERKNKSKVSRGTKNPRGKEENIFGFNGKKIISNREMEVSRIGQAGKIGIQAIEEANLYLSQRNSLSYALQLGDTNCSMVRQKENQLEVRTKNDSIEKRGLLFARLLNRKEYNYRGEGVYVQERPIQDKEDQTTRVRCCSVRSEEIKESGYSIVKSIETIKVPARIYDIQTSTSNFYTRGKLGNRSFHVHNCAVGCNFCYVNSGMRGYRGSGLITVPLNYGELVKYQLSKMYKAAAGYFSSFTDPFTPLEAYYHNTQRAAEEFVKVGLPIFFLSRLRYPDWAIKLLTINKHSYAQKSLNTCDGEDWRYLSPGALPLKQHLADITKLRKKGIYVSIQCNPVVAGVTSHEQIEKLFSMLANAGANHVIVKFVEAGYSWAPAMVERMIKRFGKRGEEFAKLFTENIGGQKTICEEYRLPAHERYSAYAKKVGLTYATCYEYRKERDSKGNVINSTGISIGREFTTAEQCHGQRVPVYQRDNLEENFKPIDECPPSGCLYCASENNGEARCGDKELGEAKALRYADYKKQLIQIS